MKIPAANTVMSPAAPPAPPEGRQRRLVMLPSTRADSLTQLNISAAGGLRRADLHHWRDDCNDPTLKLFGSPLKQVRPP